MIREMKEPDDSMPFHPRSSQKRPKESAGPSGGLKLARQGPVFQPRVAPIVRLSLRVMSQSRPPVAQLPNLIR